jgi:hypothetical protein
LKTSRTRWPGAFGRDHAHVDVGRRLDHAKADVEAVGKHQRVARLEVGRDILLVDFALDRVGQRHHDHVSFGAGFGGAQHAQPVAFGLRPALAARVETDAHIHTAVACRLSECACPWLP